MMSERYGRPGELKELFEDLEGWVREEIEDSEAELRRLDGLGDPRYEAGRLMAFRDMLERMIVNPGG